MKTVNVTVQQPDPGGAGEGSVLGSFLREARVLKTIKQSDIAKRLGISASHVSYFENGTRQPSIAQLAALAQELNLNMEAMLLARSADEVVREGAAGWPESMRDQQRELIAKLRGRIQNCGASGPRIKTSKRTFMDFPEGFGEVVIVTGDKREEKPKNAGDIGAYSASPIDDRWIWLLGLHAETEKVSDKEFVISSDERLRELYGRRTLLVVGSPASNHLARIINRQAPFRFNFHGKFAREIDQIISGVRYLRDPSALEKVKLEKLDKLKSIMRKFYSYGIVDPVKGDVNGFAAAPDRDFATITFAINPYSEQNDFTHPAVMVAGFHLPGTAHALKCVGLFRNSGIDPNLSFSKRPYGGVLEIKFNPELPWEDRMKDQVEHKWETSEYTFEKLQDGLRQMIGRKSELLEVNDEDIAAGMKLLDGI